MTIKMLLLRKKICLRKLVLRPEGQAIIATDMKKQTIIQKKTMSQQYKGSGRKICWDAYNKSWSILLLALKIKSEIRIRLPGE